MLEQDQDNLSAPPKRSELPPEPAPRTAAPKKAAVKKKTAAKKPAAYKRPTSSIPDNNPLPAKSNNNEPVLDPLQLLQSAGPMRDIDEVDEYAAMNKIEKDIPGNGVIQGEDFFADTKPNMIQTEAIELPKIRKVAIKKISRFLFRLGMEKTEEDFKIVPGASHTWMCDKKGREFITGLDDKPEERARLERLLHVDLSPTSDFWSTLTFQLEDKKHGQIMNFDDRQMGPHYEVIFYAMQKSSMIANGLQEYNNGTKPMAEWFIENKEAEAEAVQQDMTFEIEATEKFTELSYSRRAGVAKLLGLPAYGVSDKVASAELWQHLRKNVTNARDFLKLARLRDDEFAVAVLVKDAIKYNVIRMNKSKDLEYANQPLGPTEEHVVAKLVQPTNSSLRLAIERFVDAKK